MVILVILLAIAVGIITALIFYVIKFGAIIIDIEDSMIESLDAIDDAYKKISIIADTPLMMDNPEIRNVLFQIHRIQDTVLSVSNVLADPFSGIDDDTESIKDEGD